VRVVLHEWACSGGLHGPQTAPLPSSATLAAVVAEGRAMLAALVADGLRAGEFDLTLLLDASRPPLLSAATGPVHVEPVPRGAELDRLVALGAGADWTLIVAPESDGLLADRVAAVRAAGGRVAAPQGAFIARAADKHATALALAAGGVPVPAGRRLGPDETWPPGFALPAVVKALDGCGGDGFARLDTPADLLPAPRPRRLERHAAGVSVGVSALCGPAGHRILPPVRHLFSAEDRRFLGGRCDLPAALADRAATLAGRAIAALERASAPAAGWVGVDMILGHRDDGDADRVLEVNPRLTTSFVGLARAGSASLLGALLATAAGKVARWPGRRKRDGSYAIATPDGAAADVPSG